MRRHIRQAIEDGVQPDIAIQKLVEKKVNAYVADSMRVDMDTWAAVPLAAGAQVKVYKNRTFSEFETLTPPMPTTIEDFRSEIDKMSWDWDTFLDAMCNISDQSGQSGFLFEPGYDNELLFTQMIADNMFQRSDTDNYSDYECNLYDEEFMAAVEVCTYPRDLVFSTSKCDEKTGQFSATFSWRKYNESFLP